MQEDSDFQVCSWMRHTVVLILTGSYMCTKACVYSHCTTTNQRATCTCSSDTPTPASSSHRPT